MAFVVVVIVVEVVVDGNDDDDVVELDVVGDGGLVNECCILSSSDASPTFKESNVVSWEDEVVMLFEVVEIERESTVAFSNLKAAGEWKEGFLRTANSSLMIRFSSGLFGL